jgi:hypothetical protein
LTPEEIEIGKNLVYPRCDTRMNRRPKSMTAAEAEINRPTANEKGDE